VPSVIPVTAGADDPRGCDGNHGNGEQQQQARRGARRLRVFPRSKAGMVKRA